ncbi:interleukin-6 receptor subunit beta-like isoform X1 [Salmo trutta]|uniref:Interleukin-6 receptor subunit beta-like n=1 Tax=Salmo trutta TaxID=8032 RepID=A0A673YKY2_SALTR|nr:interleukin-6 receptor subunit beta-like isoform X1 [Salmo trutta]
MMTIFDYLLLLSWLLLSLSLGVLFEYFTTLSSPLQVSPVSCGSKNISSYYGHCVTSQEGVRELVCFVPLGLSRNGWECVWTPRKHIVYQTHRYTLIIEQKMIHSCKMYANISRTSQTFNLSKKRNMTAYVFDESDPKSCTKNVFRGSPQQLVRCGPPSKVDLNRHSRQLDIQASWRKEENKYIVLYSVRYKDLKSQSWKEPPVQSKDSNRCTLGNLNSSLSYVVQIQCVANDKCTQCPWSKNFTVPPELTDKPVIEMVEDFPQTKGSRLVIIKWKFAASDLAEGYSVTVGKASGEDPIEAFNTSRTLLRLALSHSAYHLTITAFNTAGTSPAAQRTIPPLDDKDLYGKLNVTFNGNTSFTVSWVDDLIKTYSCFSVEWWRRGERAAYKSFYEDENNYEVIHLEEPLELYKKYTFTLHTRPHKEPCNLKFINNSESTYGSIQAFFTEGSPISAPGNISSSNVSQSSMVLEWTAVPEEDNRGFLLGYFLHYTERLQDWTDAEPNITVDAGSTSYELVDLQSSTVYRVQLSAFTGAGMGVRSSAAYFETKPEASLTVSGVIAGAIVGVTLLFLVVHLGSQLLKRAKKLLWPNIPNPSNSNAIQKIDGVCDLELLELINRQMLKEEEGDSNSLHIVDGREEMSPVGNLHRNADSCLHLNTDHEESQGPSLSTIATDRAQDPTSDTITSLPTDRRQTDPVFVSTVAHQCHPLAFQSDYTTMELFQQAMPQCVPTNTSSSSLSSLESQDQSSQISQARSVKPDQS